MSTFGAELADALVEMRALAESRMRTTWQIQAGPTTTYDPDLKQDVTTYEVDFSTLGRLRVRSALSQHAQQAGAGSVVEVTRELHIPIASPLVPQGAVATCVALDDTSDPTLLGTTVVVEGPAEGDQMTARRLKVTELASSTYDPLGSP